MKIQLLSFGIARDLLGSSSIEIEIPNEISIESFKKIILKQFPKIASVSSYAIAVNEEYANDSLVLKENDVVAIIPPVSGG
ncbi:molybdopterin synthase sulfur carrier subunit [Tenacibaculum sp. E3R01]|uniref:MoaD/ThiS family protein n=1 Tax=Tenacibaculum sp. E3R01 TaxID=2267227 RepID=UPI000DEB9D95|nr:MoaD/ThiS family protein [Tenacibaculum sp. E3R01]RBW59755.1 molybdopterin synthase sulfur carrier subunit [Tenacibaculum sp. E3R01]